jgi:5-methyltetrahydrofolate--homocysteine methyltransferase
VTGFLDALDARVLICDGAMGTMLYGKGIFLNRSFDELNLTQPDLVGEIHQAYVRAGADVLETNTFGANRLKLAPFGLGDRLREINAAGVRIARRAFEQAGRDGYVIGDVGPFGGLMEPYGDFTEDQVRAAFTEQAKALVDAGADAIIIETQTGLEELGIGIEAAKEAGAACIIGSMAYDVTLDGSTFRTMMGVDPERAAEFMMEQGADVVALNCGTRMDMERARDAVERYKSATDLPVMAQPNAGQPKLVNMKVVYDETPEQMVKGVQPLLEAGANIVGGCCGSTPDHIRAFRGALDAYLKKTPAKV